MLKLRGFQQALYGYVDVLSINESSMQPQLLPGTLTFLVCEDEEVSKECLPWNVLSNSVLVFVRGVATEDLDRPNAWRHHESETNVQTAEVLQATHWMHYMAAHTQGIVWKMIESRSRSWLCCLRKQMLSKFVQTPVASKRFPQRCPHDGSVWFASPLRAIKQRLAAKGFQAQPHAKRTCFEKDDAKREPGPETWRNQWTSMQNLTDMAMVLFFQYQQCNISRPMRLQFLWKDGREILAMQASLRISLVMVWNHLESTCNARAWNPQRLEQRARLQQLCRYRRDRTKITRSSRWSLCRKVLLERRPEEDQAALGEAGNRACQRFCKTLVHAFAKSLRTQHLKWLRKCADQSRMVQDIALVSARCRNAAKNSILCIQLFLETPGLQTYPDTESSTPD